MDSTPTLTATLRAAIEDRMSHTWTAALGKILAYDSAARIAQIQLLDAYCYVDETGNVRSERIAPLRDVPVVRLGGGPFRVAMPVAAGDACLVVFCANPIGRWTMPPPSQVLRSGDDYVSATVGLSHALGGAVAIAGVAPTQASGELADDSAVLIGSSGGPCVRISETDVQIGATAALKEPVGTLTDLAHLAGVLSDPGVISALAALPAAYALDAAAATTAFQAAIASYFAASPVPGSSTVKAER